MCFQCDPAEWQSRHSGRQTCLRLQALALELLRTDAAAAAAAAAAACSSAYPAGTSASSESSDSISLNRCSRTASHDMDSCSGSVHDRVAQDC